MVFGWALLQLPTGFPRSEDIFPPCLDMVEVIIPRGGDLVVVLTGDGFVVGEGTLSLSFSFDGGMFFITFDNDEEILPWGFVSEETFDPDKAVLKCIAFVGDTAFLLFGNCKAVFPACFGLWKVTLPADFWIDKLCFSTAFCFGETLLPPPFFFSVADSSISFAVGYKSFLLFSFCVLTFPMHFILDTQVLDLIFGTEYSVDP
ncbi:hypothetical protein XELAEV_18017093mg [Xenopus laevis]|uniref:Uncharacterized protein n=1 Tax=Xenopus laevis TaxID=8355 RepID=A0A974DD22_XENLA|nr:hypothetical protein XELAEV_18017093mg [Xenopus laevis]